MDTEGLAMDDPNPHHEPVPLSKLFAAQLGMWGETTSIQIYKTRMGLKLSILVLGSEFPNDQLFAVLAIASVSDVSAVLHCGVHIEDLSPRLPGPCLGIWRWVRP